MDRLPSLPSEACVSSLHCILPFRQTTTRTLLHVPQSLSAFRSSYNDGYSADVFDLAGAWVGVGYTLIGLIAWVGSYFFRVATKNMTYAVQLKNYEQAVIEKRFSELEEDEVDALLDEVNEQ